jgi:hypothetical protein
MKWVRYRTHTTRNCYGHRLPHRKIVTEAYAESVVSANSPEHISRCVRKALWKQAHNAK